MVKPEVNLFDLYFAWAEDTEPPAIFHRWSLITAMSAVLGRQMWFPFGVNRLFANHYTMFVGEPGTRKSTAIRMAAKLVGMAGYDKFSAQKTSMEKFLVDLQEDNTDEDPDTQDTKRSGVDILASLNLKTSAGGDSVPREMFIAADEFNIFLGAGNLAFQSLLGELWDWDEPDRLYKQRLKNSKSISVYQPTITILGGNTPSSFAECFPLASIGQGFMSRLILIHAEPSGKKWTFPEKPDEALTLRLLDHILRIRATCIGPMQIGSEERSALDLIYRGWSELEDTRFKHYSSRRFTHLLKLCMVVCAARASVTLTMADILHANTVLAYAESTMPKAIGELGKSKNAEAANKIMQALYSAREAKSVNDLWKIVQNDLDKISDLLTLLMNLQQADKIQVVTKALGGKDGYLPKQRPMSRSLPFTNFDILKGRELK